MSQPPISHEFDYEHPVDKMEPEEESELREIQMRFRFILDRALAFILDAEDSEIAAWQVAFALECPHCMGLTMTKKSAELGVGRAAMSRGANAFCRIASVPPSKYMMRDKARESYRKIRKDQEKSRKDHAQ